MNQAVYYICRPQLSLKVFFRQYGSEIGAAGTEYVHRMGCSRNMFQYCLDLGRQTAKRLEFFHIIFEFGLGRQFTVNQKISHFFKGGLPGKLDNIITAIMQVISGASHGAYRRVACYNTGQDHRLFYFWSCGFRRGSC